MKKCIALLSIILIITSCDVEEGPFINDYDSYVNPDKKVLIEDFTGHTCQNCPDAARELDAIQDIYPNQIIGIALHISSFAIPHTGSGEFEYDFRTEWGDKWEDFFGLYALPSGMINRIGFENETHVKGKGEWAEAVANELKKEINFKIYISSDETSISITSEVQNNINADYNLVVCLTESNIINWQKDGQENVENYEHNHVLRAVLADQALSNSANYVAGQEIEKSITIDLTTLEQDNIYYSANIAEGGNGNADGWIAENLSVVAYIYNTTTMEIVQVEEAHLNN